VHQEMTATARSGMGVASVTEDLNWSLRLLECGVVSAPLFVGVVLVEAVTRQGFDLVRMPLSLLSLGDTGWVQRANFIACGLLFALASVGMARRRIPGGGVWGTRLVGVFAIGLVAAGLFSPDPALGFPLGAAPAVAAEVQSWHSQLHGAAFDVAFLSAIMACFLFAHGFASIGEVGSAAYAAITGLMTPILIVLGFANTSGMGLLFFAAGALTMTWVSVSCRIASRRLASSGRREVSRNMQI
jgi:Protein of unknown function (DUF998)